MDTKPTTEELRQRRVGKLMAERLREGDNPQSLHQGE